MAEDITTSTDNELQLDRITNKKKLFITAGVVLVLFLVIVSSAVIFFSRDDGFDEELSAPLTTNALAGNHSHVDANVNIGSALYVPMPRAFRFNVPGALRDRLVEIKVQLMVRGNQNDENTKKHIPLIESTLLKFFSQANADDLATSAGKVTLKQKSLTAVQKAMKEMAGNKTIEKVLFTGFVMQ